MKYLCLIYHNEEQIDALSTNEYDAIMSDVLAYRDELRQSGHYIISSPLQPVREATTIRVRDSRVSITDGPFAETKEQLGGIFLVDLPDLDEAIRLASLVPAAEYGSLEIRPTAR
jgi:hypothetical protein